MTLVLGHAGTGGLQGVAAALQLGLGLASLGFQTSGIHACHHLIRFDEVALVDQDLRHPSCELGGDVDLRRFDAAVAAGEGVAQPLGLEPVPERDASEEEGGADDQPAQDGKGERTFHAATCGCP